MLLKLFCSLSLIDAIEMFSGVYQGFCDGLNATNLGKY